jgi:hypothetical protein
MKTDTFTKRPPVLADMTQVYDPAYSYVVIEQRLEVGEKAGFQRVNEALFGLETEIVDQELVKDPSTGENKLIIKMKHQETEEIMLALLGAGLKKNYHCYVY